MVYIALVNWNGWSDTLECLESLFRLEETGFTVVLCDNASEDSSVEKIKSWAQGKLAACAADSRYEDRIGDGVSKPISCTAWKLGENAGEVESARIVLISANKNMGFAGGCNICMNFALERGDAEFVWLLNNDTVVEPATLTHLIAKMRREPCVGLCGSTIRYYFDPAVVQCYAGHRFNEWIGRVLPIVPKHDTNGIPRESDIESCLKFVNGASIMVRRDFLESVGLLNEQYFLYFEEMDWAVRSRGRYTLGYCSDSIVYHKEGRSIGSSRSRDKRSLFSESYLSRNRVLFTRTYFPARLPIIMAWVTLVSIQRILCGRYPCGRIMFVSAWKGLLSKPTKAS